jgi:CxxC-x17-CxxC domain-containing protein
MARFEHSRDRESRGSPFNRNDRNRRSFEDGPTGRRHATRDSKRNSRGRRDFEMTKVTCASCGNGCEVPFKPTSNRPVYCSDCFGSKNKGNSPNSGMSERDLDIINEKLNKIMKALDIE